MSFNKVCLIGNLGKDPEVRAMQNGGKVVNMTIATSESWRDKNSGERREKTEWHRITIFNEGLGGIAEKFLKKGSQVYLEGSLRTRKWTDDKGIERYTTEVVLGQFNGVIKLLDKRNADGGGEGSGETPSPAETPPETPNGPIDDDIPF